MIAGTRGLPRRGMSLVTTSLVVLASVLAWVTLAEPAGKAATFIGVGQPSSIDGEYVVGLRKDAVGSDRPVTGTARRLAAAHHGRLGSVWDRSMYGFSVSMSAADAMALAADPRVAFVEADRRWVAAAAQPNPPSWGLDRVDQRDLPRDQNYYSDDNGGAGVRVYVVDTGIRISNTDFEGRASYGANFIKDGQTDASDCGAVGLGHGTAVAGVIGGAAYGVAKRVQLIAVRVVDCHGFADTTSVEDGINWVVRQVVDPGTGKARFPAVINLSLGDDCEDAAGHPVPCPVGEDQAIEAAEAAAIAGGIPVVAAAGNDNQDACNNPYAAVDGVLTVGAVDETDARSDYSNFGRCVDLWAPGDNIVSDYNRSDTATATKSGTSLATPHVSGAVALLMGTARYAHATPAQITTRLQAGATEGILGGLDQASPNKLLFTAVAPPSGGEPVALAPNADGRLELFGVTTTGVLMHRSQQTAGASTWGGWVQAATRGWVSVAAVANAAACVELGGLTAPGGIFRRTQAGKNAAGWFNWTQIPGSLTSAALAANQNGQLEMLGANTAGQVFYSNQIAGANWAPWAQLSLPAGVGMASVTAARGGDGRIVVAGVDTIGNVWYTLQTTANTNTWPTPIQINHTLMSDVALAANRDGSLELVGSDGAGRIWRAVKLGGGWAEWSPLAGSKTLRHLAAATNADGRVQIVGVDPAGNIWQTAQTTAGAGSYVPWTPIGGQLRT